MRTDRVFVPQSMVLIASITLARALSLSEGDTLILEVEVDHVCSTGRHFRKQLGV